MTHEEAESGYVTEWIPITDLLWGRGIITPGGRGNIARIVQGIDLRGKRVLDYGSGVGGGTITLAREYGANVVGLEIDSSFVEFSRNLAAEEGLSDEIEFRHIKAGPLPIDDASFDCFYSSGVICHVKNKKSLFSEAYRILKPGGWALGYDWFVLKSNAAIDGWLEILDAPIYPSKLQGHIETLTALGFHDVTGEDSTDWYIREANTELERLRGTLFEEAASLTSPAIRDHFIHEWQCMKLALATGDVKQGYFRGHKPD
jgi:SAM-dependent methyltransferase